MEEIDCKPLKEESTFDINNEVQKSEKLKSLELLKKKMCRSHDLIQNYNDKFKECEQLKISLRTARAEANEMKSKFNTTLSKFIKQELQNTEQRKLLETKANEINELETKISAHDQLIQQYNCKIKGIQEEHSNKLMCIELDKLKFEEKIKALELENKKLQKCRVVGKIAKKDRGVNTDKVKVAEIETNDRLDGKILDDPLKKNVTNGSKNATKQNSTFLCKKCDIALDNLVKTFKAPEPMIQPLPPENQFKFKASESFAKLKETKIVPEVKDPLTESPAKQEESATMKVLTKTLKTLDRVIKINKKSAKKSQCCSSNSGNQDLMLQIMNKLLEKDHATPSSSRDRKPRKKLKRCQNTRKSIAKKKKTKTKNSANWSIESVIDSEPSTSRDSFKIPQIFDHHSTLKTSKSDNFATKKQSNKLENSNHRILFSPEETGFSSANNLKSASGEKNSQKIENFANIPQDNSEKQIKISKLSNLRGKSKNQQTIPRNLTLQSKETKIGRNSRVVGVETIKVSSDNFPTSSEMQSLKPNEFKNSKSDATPNLRPNETQSLKRKEFSSDESFEDSIKTSTPRKNKLISRKNSKIEQPCKKRLTSPLPEFSNISFNFQGFPPENSKTLVTPLNDNDKVPARNENEIVSENSGQSVTKEENSENQFEILGEAEISEKGIEIVEIECSASTIEIEERNFENSGQKIDTSDENMKSKRETIKMKMEDSEKVENSVKEEVEIQNPGVQNSLENSTGFENFKGFQNAEVLENSEQVVNLKKLEDSQEFDNFKGFEILKDFENFEKLENQNESENLKNSAKQSESVARKKASDHEFDNKEEKIKNPDEEFENQGKMQNLETKLADTEEDIKNSGQEFRKFENEMNSPEENSLLRKDENLPEKLLNVTDVLGEISFSDESVVDCDTFLLSFATEKSQTTCEESQFNKDDEKLQFKEEEELEFGQNETESKNASESPNESEFQQKELQFERESQSQFIEEPELSETESKLENKSQNNEEADDANIFISSSDIARIPKNSIHGNRSKELRLTLISPKRRGRKRKTPDDSSGNSGKTTRANLLTRMRTMKKRSQETIVTPTAKKIGEKKEAINSPKSNFSDADFPLMSRKRRIAHTPKAEDDFFTQSPIRKSLRSASKSPRSARNSLSSQIDTSSRSAAENSPRTRNNSKVDSSPKEENNVPPKIVETSKIEVPVVRKRGRPRKIKPPEEARENLPEANSPKENPPTANFRNLPETNLPNANSLEANSPEANLSTVNSSTKQSDNGNEIHSVLEGQPEKIENDGARNETEDRLESPLSPDASEKNVNDLEIPKSIPIIPTEEIGVVGRNDSCSRITTPSNDTRKFSEKPTSPDREFRSGSVDVVTKKTVKKYERDFKSLDLPITNPMFSHMNSRFVKTISKGKGSQKTLENSILFQLDRLVDSELWTSELHFDVVEQISKLSDAKIVAKCIVSFLMDNFNNNKDEPLDKTNTPPAPMMTRTQQKIVTLISALENCEKLNVSMPDIFQFVFDGINFSLFRLGSPPEKCVIEGMSRIFTVMARLKKDRERARLFIIDALYCHRFKATVAIFVVLTCWPEVFPTYDSNSDSTEILPKCMAHIIYSTEGCYDALKNLLSHYYNYPRADITSDQLAVEFLSTLEKKHETSTDIAIILLAKRMGPKWTQKMIIQGEFGLKQLIVGKRHPSPYDAFTLLGSLMRSFPEEDSEGHISQIVEQLCDLLDSNEGSEDHLEGVASALLCFSKFRKFFCKVAKSLLQWTPTGKLRDETLTKFQFFCNSHSKFWWYDCIKSNYALPLPEIRKNTQTAKPQGKVIPKMNKKKKRTKNVQKKEGKLVGGNIPSTSQ